MDSMEKISVSKLLQEFEEETGIPSEELAEQLGVPLAVYKEWKQDLFPPLFLLILLQALSVIRRGIIDQAFIKEAEKWNKEYDEHERRRYNAVNAKLTRKPNGDYSIEYLPE